MEGSGVYTSEGGSEVGRLVAEKDKLQRKLTKVQQRRDHYARLYYRALAELDEAKWELSRAKHKIRELQQHTADRMSQSGTTSPDSGTSLSPQHWKGSLPHPKPRPAFTRSYTFSQGDTLSDLGTPPTFHRQFSVPPTTLSDLGTPPTFHRQSSVPPSDLGTPPTFHRQFSVPPSDLGTPPTFHRQFNVPPSDLGTPPTFHSIPRSTNPASASFLSAFQPLKSSKVKQHLTRSDLQSSRSSTHQPSYSRSSTQQPCYSRSSTQQPSYNRSSTQQPSCSRSSTQQPSYSRSSTQQPSYSRSSTQQPSCNRSSTQQPSYSRSSTQMLELPDSSQKPNSSTKNQMRYECLNGLGMLDLLSLISSTKCSITSLEVAKSQLGEPEAMRIFCEDLIKNTSIASLSLPENGINMQSLTILLEAVQKCSQLRELLLRNNCIGVECVESIKLFLSHTTLDSLVLTGNDIERYSHLLSSELPGDFSMEYSEGWDSSGDSGVATREQTHNSLEHCMDV